MFIKARTKLLSDEFHLLNHVVAIGLIDFHFIRCTFINDDILP
jgi:hypothetical protein